MKRAAVYLSALALLLFTLAASGAPAAAAVTPPAPTTAADITDRATRVQGLGTMWDSGRTHQLPDGRWLTLTGDATSEAGQQWPVYDNAAVVWDATGQYRVASTGGDFFPRWDDGSEFWPHDFIVIGARAYVIGSRVKTYSGTYNWDAMGAYGAVVDLPTGGDPAFAHYFPTPSSLLDDMAVQWYGAVAYDGTYVYVHGVKDRPEAFHARDGGYVARVTPDRLEVPHRWQFWTGSGWTGRDDLAVPTIPIGQEYTTGLNGTSSSYTLHRRPNGQWQVTTKRGGDLATSLGRYVSANPWGPWTWQDLATVCDLDCYLSGANPDIPTVSGQLLVQWSRTGSTPQWIEVPQ